MDKIELLENFKQTVKQFLQILKGWEHADVVENVYLYGSFVKGCATSRSDIDICIIVKEGVSPSWLREFRCACFDIDGIELDIHFRTTTSFAENTLYNLNVKQEGKSIWKVK